MEPIQGMATLVELGICFLALGDIAKRDSVEARTADKPGAFTVGALFAVFHAIGGKFIESNAQGIFATAVTCAVGLGAVASRGGRIADGTFRTISRGLAGIANFGGASCCDDEQERN